MMHIQSPRLWCASPDIEPGTIKLDWISSEGFPDSLTIAGNDANTALEQFRAAPDERARAVVLVSLIEDRRAA